MRDVDGIECDEIQCSRYGCKLPARLRIDAEGELFELFDVCEQHAVEYMRRGQTVHIRRLT